ncbi:MAG: PQQ-dependent sugar dehydrogenase [Rhodobacter sp.]|nr:PQQ-dependent sugar dehydrogenase [Rhodobacter sp.]
MRLILVILTFLAAMPAMAAQLATSAGAVRVEPVMTGLDAPWGVGFLPDGGVLVTERGGRLLHRRAGGTVVEVDLRLDIAVAGQGGLLDVMVPRDFAASREVFLSFAKRQRGGSGTALAVGRLNAAGDRLNDVRVIFEMAPGTSGGRHFGSRIVEARDGTLFLTIGDRGDRPSAQDLNSHAGAVIRVNRDGSVPADNPFVGQAGARPEIWSYGHRNPQGATLDASGQLWAVEHGARGGDEVNKVRRGLNYGWPVIAYGRHYSGLKIGEGTAKPGMEQPEFYWDPSIAPSGMMVYSGKLWPEWRGDMFIGSLKFDYISRLSGATFREVEQIEGDETARVRDIREAPDGAIWFLSVNTGTLYRMTPG